MHISSPARRVRAAMIAVVGLGIGLGIAPGIANAHPALSTDLNSQDDFVAMASPMGATPVHRRLDVAFINLDDQAGPLRYGVTFQYGSTFAVNPNDYIGHEADHHSLRIDREIYIGATASLPASGPWRLVASAGAIQMRLHDGFDDGTRFLAFNRPDLTGWRVMVGAQRPLGPTLLTMGWQMASYPGQHQSDPSQPTTASASRVGVDITTPF